MEKEKKSAQHRWHDEKKAQGLCFGCGKPPALNRTLCQKCLDNRVRYNQTYWAKRWASPGDCNRCGKPLAPKWKYKRCLTCLEQNQGYLETAAEKRDKGTE